MTTSPARHEHHSVLAAKAGTRARQLVSRRAIATGLIAVVPVPGLGLIVDVSMIARLVADINELFGLAPEQLSRLTPTRQRVASQAIITLGTTAVGRTITRRVVFSMLRRVGVRVTAGEVTRVVPFAGQLVSGLLSYSALRIIGERHVRQCEAVLEVLVGPLAGDLEAVEPVGID